MGATDGGKQPSTLPSRPDDRILPSGVIDSGAMAVVEALLTSGSAALSQIAAIAGLPLAECQRHLLDLHAKGLIEPSLTEDNGWRLVHPSRSVGQLIAEAEATVGAQLGALAALRALESSLSQRFPLTTSADTSPCVTLLTDTDAVSAALDECSRRSTRLVTKIDTERMMPEEVVRQGRSRDDSLADRGVGMHLLVPAAFTRDRKMRSALIGMQEQGTQVRSLPVVPPRRLVFDTHSAIVPITTEQRQGALLVRDPDLVQHLAADFDVLWGVAEPLDTPAREPLIGITKDPQVLNVLRLLAGGATDETIARATRQSSRTVRRIISGLMTETNAQSRFQLALVARDHGWV